MVMADKNPSRLISELTKDENETENAVEETPTQKVEETKKEWDDVVADLIADEQEAIEGYESGITYLEESDLADDVKNSRLEVLRKIKADEEQHIKDLENIKDKPNAPVEGEKTEKTEDNTEDESKEKSEE